MTTPTEPVDYALAHAKEALAGDPRTGELEVDLALDASRVVVTGVVTTPQRQAAIVEVLREVLPDREVRDHTTVAVAEPPVRPRVATVRVAAVGDIHVGTDASGTLRGLLEPLADQADLLLVAGDLTRHGTREEAEVAGGELGGLRLPVVAVLGNHDYHSDQEAAVTEVLEASGVRVLEGSATVVDLDGVSVGVAGTKGFGGGFPGRCGSDFGEPEMKAFVRHSKALAATLEEALAGLDTDIRIALLHYAPVSATLAGEPPEIHPFLGSFYLAEAIDRAGADLAVHGHAHRGSREGVTPGGVLVRNVAEPVIRRPYELLCLERGADGVRLR